MSVPQERPSVAIIGAGISGLVTARHLKDVADVIILECRSSYGGLWSTLDKNSPIDVEEESNLFLETYGCQYRNVFDGLVLNIPTMFAHFKDFPHSTSKGVFMTREQFNAYINRYVQNFGLGELVRFNTFVNEVRRVENLTQDEQLQFNVPSTGYKKFVVVSCDSRNRAQKTWNFADYVIVANGHNNVPYIPSWPGVSDFQGTIIHSRDFRRPDVEQFLHKRILVAGSGLSGMEILYQFFGHPRLGEIDAEVYFCETNELILQTTDFRPWLDSGKLSFVNSRIEKLEGKHVFFVDGQYIEIDTIVVCTGYKFAFPFLQKGNENFIHVQEDGRFYGPLYRKTFSINEPKLCFVGNIDRTCFIQKIMELQAIVIKGYINGDINLPGKEEMIAEFEADLSRLPTDKKKDYYKPECASKDDRKIMQDLFLFDPTLQEKNSKLMEGLMIVGQKLVEMVLAGNFLSLKKTDFGKYFENFEWDST